MEFIKKHKNIITIIIIIILITFIIYLMIMNGYIIPTKIEAEKYEVKGVDVSEYQGEIDWDKIESQGISFAFIKATEGSKSKDNYFDTNFTKLKQMDNMLIGCYHFFSFETTGEEQAQNYINVVGNVENDSSLIIPIVDIEYYSYYKKAKPSKEWILEELQNLLDKMEEEYKIKPIIYTTIEFYNDYLKDNFKYNNNNNNEGYDLWIRNIISNPSLNLENTEWKFWQYTGKGRLDGYKGEEKFIDLNVFNGSKSDFDKYVQNKKDEKKEKIEKEEKERIEKEENTLTNIGNTVVTNINREGSNTNNITVKMQNGETLNININNIDNNDNNIELDGILFNMRTQEKIDVSEIKVNDEIDLENIYKKQGNVVFSEESKVYVTRYLSDEELKKELLSSEFSFDLEYMEKKANNYYILKGKIYDWYYNYSSLEEDKDKEDDGNNNGTKSFEIEIVVNNNTQILGIKGKVEEQLKELYKYGLYISLDKNELKKGNLIAINIEGMGC